MGSLRFYFILLQVFHLVHNVITQPTFSYYKCIDKNGNYTNDSRYEKNLQEILLEMSSNTQINYGFYNFSVGQKTDRAYGIALCRGDVTAVDCRGCISSATIMLKQLCPAQKEAIGYYGQCMLRYSDRFIFRTMEITPSFAINSTSIHAPNVTVLEHKLGTLFDKLRNQAAVGDFRLKYAIGEVNITTSLKVYALTQCTPDLSSSDCSTCLKGAFTEIASCCKGLLGVTIKRPSCSLEFNNFASFKRLDNQPSGQSNSTAPLPDGGKNKSGKRTELCKTWIIIIASTFFVLLVVATCCCSRRSRHIQREAKKTKDQIRCFDSLKFNFDTIKAATEDFSNTKRVHEGASVYKGVLPGGQEIAVKKLPNCSIDTDQCLKNEVLLLANLQQRNLVKLLGFCVGKDLSLLIYEFQPNKSLDQFLNDPMKRMCLDWETRRKIILGIARGLVYLHEDSHLRVIHCGLIASNILLGEDMNPKISNFRMARLVETSDQTKGVTTQFISAYKYKLPQYVQHQQFSIKSDVFSFGVLLLEIITGQTIRDFSNDENEDLISFAWRKWSESTIYDVIDPTMLRNPSHTNQILRSIKIALLCVQENLTSRPSMSTVLFMLNSSMVVIEEPSRPRFNVLRDRKSDIPSVDDKHQMNRAYEESINETSITLPEPR